MGGQLDGIFLASSLPHEFIILIVTLFICLWLINFSLSLSLSLATWIIIKAIPPRWISSVMLTISASPRPRFEDTDADLAKGNVKWPRTRYMRRQIKSSLWGEGTPTKSIGIWGSVGHPRNRDRKISAELPYRRRTARRAMSVEMLSTVAQL